jgi:hypothetical protein
MKRFLACGIALALALLVSGCGGKSAAKNTAAPSASTGATDEASGDSSEHFDASNWDVVESDPDAHKGARAEFVGKVFSAPERDAKGTYLQVWEDAQNSENNVIVGYADPNFAVEEGDYVRVVGTVKGKFTGKNAFGAELTVPTVIADTVKVVGATAAAPPPLAMLGRATGTQAGITITVSKVEFAAGETRVFVHVRNGSNASVSIYDSSAKAVQNGRQYDATFSTADYPQLSDDLVAGASTSGVIVFPKMKPGGSLKLILEANSDNSGVGDYGTLTYTFTWP